MKLKINLSELIRLGERMSPEGSGFILGEKTIAFEPIDIELESGIKINIAELDASSGLISFKGRQVLLYIRDHSQLYDNAIAEPSRGNKFHIAWCKTLDTMRQDGRFGRYHATNRLDGFFEIDDGHGRHQDVALKVCKNCLEKLNYRESANKSIRQNVFSSFVLRDFFSHYSTCFRYMPTGLYTSATSGYSSDWKDISAKTRHKKQFICTDCGADMSSHRGLCDVHHKNGVKYDNADNNLEVVCRDCHRKKPQHGGMYLSFADMKIIQSLRLQQKLNTVRSWQDVYSLTDTSIHGDIKILEMKNYPLPQLFYQIKNPVTNKNHTLDAAWVSEKMAINLEPVGLPGWTIFNVSEAVSYMNER